MEIKDQVNFMLVVGMKYLVNQICNQMTDITIFQAETQILLQFNILKCMDYSLKIELDFKILSLINKLKNKSLY